VRQPKVYKDDILFPLWWIIIIKNKNIKNGGQDGG